MRNRWHCKSNFRFFGCFLRTPFYLCLIYRQKWHARNPRIAVLHLAETAIAMFAFQAKFI